MESNLTSSAGEGIITGQRVAYTRVSTLDQKTGRQLDGIAVDTTFTDKASGKDVQRPQLAAMLGFVWEGDVVLVHSMDRLARNLDDLRRVVRELTSKGVRVQSVKEQLTFTGDDTAMANLLASVVGGFAEFEGALIGERQREGITLAKQRGAYRGRKESLTEDQVDQRGDGGDGAHRMSPGLLIESTHPAAVSAWWLAGAGGGGVEGFVEGVVFA